MYQRDYAIRWLCIKLLYNLTGTNVFVLRVKRIIKLIWSVKVQGSMNALINLLLNGKELFCHLPRVSQTIILK